MSGQKNSVSSRLKKIHESYINQLPSRLETIKEAYSAVCRDASAESALEDLHRSIHTLRGSSATFGLSRLSDVAAGAESLVKEAIQAGNLPSGDWYSRMESRLVLLKQELSRINVSPEVDSQNIELVTAAEVFKGREQKTVYLCEDDPFQRLTLTTQIECFGFHVVPFGELEQLRNAVQDSPPDAIVIDQNFPERPLGGAELMADIQSGREVAIPTVFITIHGDLPSRLSAVRAGASAFFLKPLNVADLCATLCSLTAVDVPEPYRIMILDDDPYLLEFYSSILQEAGMITKTLSDPLQILGPLFDFQPDLILTDMNMPGCNGMELAKVIRQINASFSIPIVYLSAETDTDKQFHAIRMGGDEFLTKPILPEHLISAVAVRAERMKIIRSLMIRDGMTGLFNHTSSKEHLDMAIAHAKRNDKNLCFAMIDVDKFKQINDNYGHPIGDQVLITLARLLQHRLRKTDIVGRFGGEEFAVILPDCDIALAVSLMDKLRESFAAIRFPVGDGFFSSTFSCGIASASCHGEVSQLCNAADKALYEAKEAGRNRVVAHSLV